MKDYGAHSYGQKPPDIPLQHRALDAARKHPFYQEVSTYVYIEPQVAFWEGAELKPFKSRLPEAFAELDRALAVSFFTSSSIPRPLAGAGKVYTFIMHPESLEILDTGIGSWRS